jgi:hypothetical protein
MTISFKFVDFWPSFQLSEYPLYKAIISNFDATLSDEPEYLFYSVFGSEHLLNPRYEKCIKVMVTGESVRPSFEICDYALSFDYLDDPRHCRWPLFAQYADSIVRPARQDISSIAAKKTKFCNFLYSNSACPVRNNFLHLLSTYKRVDSGGAVENNLGYRVTDKLAFQSDYKFTIAFENKSHPGYVTEKIAEPLAVHSVPIYWGSPRIAEDFNPAAFVNCHDYPNMTDVVGWIMEINRDDELYRKYLAEPPFVGNRLPLCCEPGYLVEFLRKVFADRAPRRHARVSIRHALAGGGWSSIR